jgi:integrase
VAHIERRLPQTPGGKVKYRVRFQDQAGRERSKTFARMVDAKAFRITVEADVARGTYLDPAAGRMTLREYAGEWLARQTFDESTRQATELRLRLHLLPYLGDHPLVAIRPSHVQGVVRSLQQTLAPRYVRVIVANLSAVLAEAVDDERIPRNPCRAGSVKLPRLDPDKVEPWTQERVAAVREALPERYRLAAVLGAGLGLRQGEAFGLAVETWTSSAASSTSAVK